MLPRIDMPLVVKEDDTLKYVPTMRQNLDFQCEKSRKLYSVG